MFCYDAAMQAIKWVWYHTKIISLIASFTLPSLMIPVPLTHRIAELEAAAASIENLPKCSNLMKSSITCFRFTRGKFWPDTLKLYLATLSFSSLCFEVTWKALRAPWRRHAMISMPFLEGFMLIRRHRRNMSALAARRGQKDVWIRLLALIIRAVCIFGRPLADVDAALILI